MTNRMDDKKTALLTNLSLSDGNIDDMEVTWLQTVGATSDQVNLAWYEVFVLNGATSLNWNNAAAEFLVALGYSGDLPGMWKSFWSDGGTVAPAVRIVLNSGGSCTFVDPATSCSTAAGTYEANDSGFTNPADTWLWTIESGVATITGSTTSKTVVVDTGDVEGEVAFTLKVVATDSVSTDTANVTIADSQTHTDVSPPVFAGTVPAQEWLTTESASLELEPYFSNPVGVLTFAITAGSLPTGVTLNTTTGEISGQPTVETTGNVTVSCTNAYGTDSTNSFAWESAASFYDPGMMTFAQSPGPDYYLNDPGGYSGNLFTAIFRIQTTESGVTKNPFGTNGAGGDRTICFLFTDGRFAVRAANTSAVHLCYLRSINTINDGNPHTVFFAFNASTGNAIFYIDGVDADDTGWGSRVAPTTGTLPTVAGKFAIGANRVGGDNLNCSMGYIGYSNTYLTNPTDFYHPTNGLQEIDEVTWTEWGAQPLYWNQFGTLTDNKGSDGNCTANGTITGPS